MFTSCEKKIYVCAHKSNFSKENKITYNLVSRNYASEVNKFARRYSKFLTMQ